jgi:hypothetical protein
MVVCRGDDGGLSGGRWRSLVVTMAVCWAEVVGVGWGGCAAVDVDGPEGALHALAAGALTLFIRDVHKCYVFLTYTAHTGCRYFYLHGIPDVRTIPCMGRLKQRV